MWEGAAALQWGCCVGTPLSPTPPPYAGVVLGAAAGEATGSGWPSAQRAGAGVGPRALRVPSGAWPWHRLRAEGAGKGASRARGVRLAWHGTALLPGRPVSFKMGPQIQTRKSPPYPCFTAWAPLLPPSPPLYPQPAYPPPLDPPLPFPLPPLLTPASLLAPPSPPPPLPPPHPRFARSGLDRPQVDVDVSEAAGDGAAPPAGLAVGHRHGPSGAGDAAARPHALRRLRVQSRGHGLVPRHELSGPAHATRGPALCPHSPPTRRSLVPWTTALPLPQGPGDRGGHRASPSVTRGRTTGVADPHLRGRGAPTPAPTAWGEAEGVYAVIRCWWGCTPLPPPQSPAVIRCGWGCTPLPRPIPRGEQVRVGLYPPPPPPAHHGRHLCVASDRNSSPPQPPHPPQ